MLHMMDRLGFKTVREITIHGKHEASHLEVGMWDFVLAEADDEWIVIPLETGNYLLTIGEALPGAKFPVKLKHVQIVLDGSAERWNQIMDVPLN